MDWPRAAPDSFFFDKSAPSVHAVAGDGKKVPARKTGGYPVNKPPPLVPTAAGCCFMLEMSQTKW